MARAHAETKTFVNAHGVGEVVLGPSTSQLLDNLGSCYSRVLGPGDEVTARLLPPGCVTVELVVMPSAELSTLRIVCHIAAGAFTTRVLSRNTHAGRLRGGLHSHLPAT